MARCLTLLMLVVTACTPTTVAEDHSAVGSTTATITGHVFYNDRRNHGDFATRRTPAGTPGTKCGNDGVFPDGTSCAQNWLGAYYAVVDVIERDDGAFGLNCKSEEILQSVAVNADGSFVASFNTDDPCRSDNDTADSTIVLSVRLRYCGAWCFSMNKADGTPYALYYPGASLKSPMPVSGGNAIAMGPMNFNSGGSPDLPNDIQIAANYFASLVDTVVKVHGDNAIPFYKDTFGEIKYVYPSTQSSTATTKSATKVVISTFENGWPSGTTSAHEYGHVLMLRAWDGDYGFDGVGISAGDTTIAPSRQIAFKEAWAELIAHAVFPLTNGCDMSSFDDNSAKPLPGALGEGASWRLNVTKSLCDWYDARDDEDLSLAGAGDHFNATDLYSMWSNLRNMYLEADTYGGDYEGEGLWFCDYVDYYTQVRKAGDAGYLASITDLIYNNNIGCYLPAP
jgi:hypothetical protein